MRKNLFIIILIICGIFTLNYITTPKIVYDKIESESYTKYVCNDLSDNEDKLETSESEEVIIVQMALNYNRYGSVNDNHKKYNDTNYKEVKKQHRKEAKQYHEGNNKRISESITPGYYQEIYVSKYSPFIDITYNYEYFMNHKNEILSEITKNKYVSNVNIIRDEKYEGNMNFTVDALDVEDVYNNRTKTGDGVVVGILESGIINTTNSLLRDTDITIRPNAFNLAGINSHTTAMAQIIAGSTGIAPGVTLLNALLLGTLSAEIDWLLDNDVDIINMSIGQYNTAGTYSSMSAYIDYIAYTYDVIMVAAAGNSGDLVDNPGLGYNVITTASCDDGGPVDDYSAFNVDEGPIKPTIAVPGTIYISEDAEEYYQGTSVSSAICSGLIALLLEDYPSLATDKARLIALICANTYESITYEYEEENGFDADTGAGMFNYQNIIDHYNTAFSYTNTTGQARTIFKSRLIYLREGQYLKAAFAHIAKADGTTSGTVFTDYDMFLKDPNGEIILSREEVSTNVMMVNYVAPTTGYYKVEIYQYSALRDTADYTGFAYSVS